MALHRNNGTAELTISNTGPGIHPDKVARVFDRFYRGDPAHNSAVEGSGLGLSIAQGIVRAHGGTIGLTSEPGKLTTVEVRLPIAAQN
jgi:signal transduction histidine kinase